MQHFRQMVFALPLSARLTPLKTGGEFRSTSFGPGSYVGRDYIVYREDTTMCKIAEYRMNFLP